MEKKFSGFVGRTYHIMTYGCQMNKNDTERMAGMLENMGFEHSPLWEEASLVILNTCSIRDKAERRVIGRFHELNFHRKHHHKSMELAIAGCMPQHTKSLILEKLPFLDYVVGVNNMEIIPELMNEKPPLGEQIGRLRPNRRTAASVQSFEERLKFQKREKSNKAWISIMFGCDKFCSYCIVPFTRGREMSRSKEAIFEEIESLEGKNFNQIVLLGQNVNSYGLTLYKDYDFSNLMQDIVDRYPWIEKLDFITSHPRDMNEKLMDVIAANPRITREIHFPSQHGDNEVLRRMNRDYSIEEYREKVFTLRKKVEGVLVGTDLIVGFPGETEEHFNRLLESCREIQYDFANTASYSPRPGTKAARMEDPIPEDVKKGRLHLLNQTLEEIYAQKGVRRPVLGSIKSG